MKPKEWWIDDPVTDGDEGIIVDKVHVIEYSAYRKTVDALKEIASGDNWNNPMRVACKALRELGERG